MITINDLDTPALLIEKSILEDNINSMQSLCNARNVAFRPHIKTHKMPHLAKMQLTAGAIGIACAKISEAEVMAEHGIDNIQIANLIIGDIKLKRLLQLSEKVKTLSSLIDSKEGAFGLSNTFQTAGKKLDVLMKIDIDYGRCGVKEIDQILNLAHFISNLKGLNLIGITTHAGNAYSANSQTEIEMIGKHEGEKMVEIAEDLRQNGFNIQSVTVGSNPTYKYSSLIPGVTEIRSGNYIFNDMIQVSLGNVSISNCAISVLTTVISTPSSDRAIIDGGSKTFSSDKGAHGNDSLKGMGFIPSRNISVTKFSEEHGIIYHENLNFKIGDRLKVIPNHACTTTNMHDVAYLVDKEIVLEEIPISARGKIN
jgi:D-serine deaminase-like pyridoxal phosphate-dependent protein